jgi:hypothetical protein
MLCICDSGLGGAVISTYLKRRHGLRTPANLIGIEGEALRVQIEPS